MGGIHKDLCIRGLVAVNGSLSDDWKTGKMAQQVRLLTALPNGPESTPSIHMVSHTWLCFQWDI